MCEAVRHQLRYRRRRLRICCTNKLGSRSFPTLVIIGCAGLFITSASGNCTYTINPNASFKVPDAPRWFHFAGRFMAKALFHGQTLRAHLAKPLYKVRMILTVAVCRCGSACAHSSRCAAHPRPACEVC